MNLDAVLVRIVNGGLPREAIDEILSEYPTLTWENYGSNDTSTRSFKLNHQVIYGLEEPRQAIDPVTFEEITVDSTTHHLVEKFIFRANTDDQARSADVRFIGSLGKLLAKK